MVQPPKSRVSGGCNQSVQQDDPPHKKVAQPR